MKEPLAYKMRPTTIDEIVGQEHLTGESQILRLMIKHNNLQSMILYGPPGIGKTSIATALAGSINLPFRSLNAAINTKSDLKQVADEAKLYNGLVLLLDEIHRLDKPKQDFLLPLIEKGEIILIGATTENPYIAINQAIRSRVHIFELHSLTKDSIKQIILRALTDKHKGLGNINIKYDDNVIEYLSTNTFGDIRYALSILELAVDINKKDEVILTIDKIKPLLLKKNAKIDKNDSEHYNLISALQKSIRGSDVNAALHYLGRLIQGGDLESICRRLLVIAYEDIGLANPQAPARTVDAITAAKQLGFPEARIPLAYTVIELSLSPKSNSALVSIDKALADIKNNIIPDVPIHLKDSHFKGTSETNYGKNYKYPHDYPNGYVKQDYLPKELLNKEYYTPKDTGKYERALFEHYLNLKNL